MKRITFLSGTLLIATVVFLLLYYPKHHTGTDEHKIETILQKFENNDWRVRDEGLVEIIRDETVFNNTRLRTGLIKFFNKEVVARKERERLFDQRGEVPLEDGEAYGEYYIELIVLAGKLKDPATIPFLVDSLEFGPGVAETLAGFGDKTIPFVIEKCREGDKHERWSCLDALFIFYRQTSSEGWKLKIREIIHNATKDESGLVRESAIKITKEMDKN